MDESDNKIHDSIYIGTLRVGIVSNDADQRLTYYFSMPKDITNLNKFEYLGMLQTLKVLKDMVSLWIENEKSQFSEVYITELHGEEFALSLRSLI